MSASYFDLLYIRDSVRDCFGATMRIDEACLRYFSEEKISFWIQYDECEGCILLEPENSAVGDGYVLSTQSPVHYVVRNKIGEICNGTYHFGEFGQYIIDLTQGPKGCHPRMMVKPDAAALQILRAALVFVALATLLYVIKSIGRRVVVGWLYTKYFAKFIMFIILRFQSIAEKRFSTPEPSQPWSSTRARIRSLDIFRGIAIAIFVNGGGGGYPIFRHSVWNGITVADLVMPWFAFAMGEALVLSLNGRLRDAVPRMTAFCQMARRALILSLFGIILVNTIWESVRLPGVLQRLAAMYLIVGALECAFMRDNLDIKPGTSFFRDISAGWHQWLATLLLVAVQVCVTLLVAAPGCPRGYMGPGGLHLSAYGMNLTNCTGGIAGHIDRVLFGPYMFSGGKYKDIYKSSKNHDPKGLLGVFSGILLVQSGAHAARVLLVFNGARDRIARWVLWSIIFGAMGGALCSFSKNGGPIPLNGNLWSVSYCLVCASSALFAQAVLYFMVDIKNKWRCQPLYYAGQNTLFLYLISELLSPWYWTGIGPWPFPTHSQLLVKNGVTMLFWLAVAFVMYKKRLFFRS